MTVVGGKRSKSVPIIDKDTVVADIVFPDNGVKGNNVFLRLVEVRTLQCSTGSWLLPLQCIMCLEGHFCDRRSVGTSITLLAMIATTKGTSLLRTKHLPEAAPSFTGLTPSTGTIQLSGEEAPDFH